jgi:hypothetical protein
LRIVQSDEEIISQSYTEKTQSYTEFFLCVLRVTFFIFRMAIVSILKSCKSTHETSAEANLFASAEQEGESPKGNPDSDKGKAWGRQSSSVWHDRKFSILN